MTTSNSGSTATPSRSIADIGTSATPGTPHGATVSASSTGGASNSQNAAVGLSDLNYALAIGVIGGIEMKP
jgi:hypothetical protein